MSPVPRYRLDTGLSLEHEPLAPVYHLGQTPDGWIAVEVEAEAGLKVSSVPNEYEIGG